MESGSLNYTFPADNIDPKKKDKRWGLQVAQAIWYNRAFTNPSLFHNVRHSYYENIEFALGLNDINEYKPMLGINPTESQKSFLPNIDWSIKNYASKRMNIATDKIAGRMYDPVFEPGDPFSLDRKKNYRSKMKAYMEQQEFLQSVNQELGLGVNLSPEDVDPELMPQNDTELDVHMSINYKDRAASWVEKRIAHFLARNRYNEIKDIGAFYEFVLGVRIELADIDAYGRPEIKWIDASSFICSYLKSPYPVDLKFAGHIEYYEVSDAIKLMEGEFSKNEIDDIINRYSTNESVYYDFNSQLSHSTYKIPIFRFEYVTMDEKVFTESTDDFGNTRFPEMDYNFYRGKNQEKKFREKNGDKAKLIRDQKDTTYVGYWIVDSDYIFKFGPKRIQNGLWGSLGQGRIGYKVCAPNLKNGVLISTIDQMKPILRELQRYHLKIQHIVSAAVPKGMAIDLEALRRADLKGPDGVLLSDMEKIKMFQQLGIFVFNPGDGKHYGVGSSQRPIWEVENGLAQDLALYIQLVREALSQLDEVIGLNEVSAASSLGERKGARVAQMQMQSTEAALSYLYKGDAHIYREICMDVAICAIRSELTHPEYYVESFGKSSADFIREYRLDKVDFGLTLEIAPSPEEWQEFYADVREAFKAGLITLSQSILIRRVKTLKEAQALLRLFEERERRMMNKAKQQDVEANMQAQQQSNEQAHANSIELEKLKQQGKAFELKMQAQMESNRVAEKMRELYIQASLDGKLTDDSIRTKGEQDRILAILNGEIEKDIEAMKMRQQKNAPKNVAGAKK